MKTLTVSNFPGCCGAQVITHFGYAKNNIGAMKKPPASMIEEDLAELDKLTGVGLRCLTLASEQREHIEPSLKKFGYKLLVENFYHPGHRSRISLYGKVMFPNQEHKIGDLKYGEAKKTTNEVARAPAPVPAAWRGATASGTRPVW